MIEKYKNVNGYDFGSNYGVYSYIMKNFCDEIYAFEPNLEAFKYLEKWTKKFDNIQIYNKAVSDKNSKIKIYGHNYNVLRIMSGMAGLAYSN